MGLKYAQTTITSGQSLSPAIQVDGLLADIIMPAAWTAAALTFQVCDTQGGTYVEAVDTAGAALSYTAAASVAIKVPTDDFRGHKFIKVRSGTSGTPVTQGADRVLLFGLSTPD